MIKLLIGGSPCTNLPTTVWKPVKGYEGFYEVSNKGDVRRVGGNKLQPKIERNGYVRYHLSKHGKASLVLAHRIVAMAFIDNPNGYNTVNHKDENKQNNRSENLEWCDMSYQNRYGIGAENRNKSKEIPVIQYNKNGEFVSRFESVKKAAELLGLNESSIHCVCKGTRRYKSTGGFVFKYESEVVSK